MEKVNDKWFKQHGWEKVDDVSTDEDGTIRHATIYELNNIKLHARWDRVIYNNPQTKKISRYYMFYAKGCTGFTVENRISYYNFTIETIIAALKVVGYNEYGEWLDK